MRRLVAVAVAALLPCAVLAQMTSQGGAIVSQAGGSSVRLSPATPQAGSVAVTGDGAFGVLLKTSASYRGVALNESGAVGDYSAYSAIFDFSGATTPYFQLSGGGSNYIGMDTSPANVHMLLNAPSGTAVLTLQEGAKQLSLGASGTITTGSADPSGACGARVFYIQSTGFLWRCASDVWHQLADAP